MKGSLLINSAWSIYNALAEGVKEAPETALPTYSPCCVSLSFASADKDRKVIPGYSPSSNECHLFRWSHCSADGPSTGRIAHLPSATGTDECPLVAN